MTKMKSKKMTKSTFAVIIMAIVMVALLAFGGTYAYFTATASDATGSAKTGTIALNMGDVATITTGFKVSGQEILDAEDGVTVSLTDTTNVSTWVFVTFTATFDAKEDDAVVADQSANVTAEMDAEDIEGLFTKDGDYALVYGVNTTDGWIKVADQDNVYAFLVEVTYETDGTTVKSKTAIPTVCESIKFYGRTQSSTTADGTELGALMDGSIEVTLTTDAIQAEGFNGDSAAAYAAVLANK